MPIPRDPTPAPAAAPLPSGAGAPPLSRADRARRNGALSRGPVSAEGKSRASRNALRHGLRARLHVVVEPEDDAAFQELGTRLFAELAPAGELEGFLVARLAAAIWKTGRGERLEAQALEALTGPDGARLGLALRYQGSVAREFCRSLRELRRLREAPLGGDGTPADPAVTQEPGDAAATEVGRDTARAAAPVPDDHAPASPPVAVVAAWGGPRPPRGCLYLRPVPLYPPRTWHQFQRFAHPAATPVLVDMQGNLLEPHGAPAQAETPVAAPPPCPVPVGKSPHDLGQVPPPTCGELRHGLTMADLRGEAEPCGGSTESAVGQLARAGGVPGTERPNEPSPAGPATPRAVMPEAAADRPKPASRLRHRLLRRWIARPPTGDPS